MGNHYTYDEIRTQPAALQKTLDVMMNQKIKTDSSHTTYLFTGCGTSYYLAIAAARFFQAVTGKPAIAVPASEIFMNPDQVLASGSHYKIITISRSGTTSEITIALESLAGNSSVDTLALTCESGSTMTQLADESFSLDHVNESSVVMTQSFSNMYYALQLFAARVAGDEQVVNELSKVPTYAEQILQQTDVVKKIADQLDYERFIFLGSGLYFGLACEGTLKLKEMTQTECESYSKLEFRHGPISIVDEHTVAILLTENRTKELDQDLSKDIQEFGGHTIAIGNVDDPSLADQVIPLNTGMSDYASSALIVPFLQMLAYYRAIKLGLNPDQPKNLNKVVKIKLPS